MKIRQPLPFYAVLLLSTCLLLPARFAAQNPSAASASLPQLGISSMVQDSLGYLWLGTRYGLQRYDAQGFERIDSQYGPQEMNPKAITSLAFDRAGQLWVGSNSAGLEIYSSRQGRYLSPDSYLSADNNVQFSELSVIFRDRDEQMWLGTPDQGLYRWRPHDRQWQHYHRDGRAGFALSANNISAIAQDAEGYIWAGTWENGLNRIDPQSHQIVQWQEAQPGQAKDQIRCISANSRGQLIFGSAGGAYRIQAEAQGQYAFPALVPASQAAGQSLERARILSIACGEAEYWLATENDGLYHYRESDKALRHYNRSSSVGKQICSNSIWSTLLDDRGLLWLGTYNQGLCKIDPYADRIDYFPKQGTAFSASPPIVSSFAQAPDGSIYLGTEGSGLQIFSFDTARSSTPLKLLPESANVVCLHRDSAGALWAGTWEAGLIRYEPSSGERRTYRHHAGREQSLAGDDIYALSPGREVGRLWISCFRAGLDLYLEDQDRFVHFSPQAPAERQIHSNLIRSIALDGEGQIWLGTEGMGLERLRLDSQFQVVERSLYTEANSPLASNYISDLKYDGKGSLWIATEGGGLHRLNTLERRFDTPALLGDQGPLLVYSIALADSTSLWFSSSAGLSRYDCVLSQSQDYPWPEARQGSQYYRAASFKSAEGHLYFGSSAGFSLVRPEQLARNPQPPRVYINGLQLFGEASAETIPWRKRRAPAEEWTLKSNQNDFEIIVSALNYSEPYKNRFRYRLQPYDPQWRESSWPPKIDYFNLAPGRYQFELLASNNDGLWPPTAAQISIRILPPWYFSTWAYLFYSLVLLALLWWARRQIIRQERLRQALHLEHLELEQTQALNAMRLRFFTDISHEFRTPLSLILAPAKKLLQSDQNPENRNKIKLIQQSAAQLLRLINEILDLAKVESGQLELQKERQDFSAFLKQQLARFSDLAEQAKLKLQITWPEKAIPLDFDRDKMEKVINNLLHNALKYSREEAEISLEVEVEPGQIRLRIRNSGEGLSEAEQRRLFDRFYRSDNHRHQMGSGIGLALCKELVELHGGRIAVESKRGLYTQFEIFLPYSGEDMSSTQDLPSRQNIVPKRSLASREPADTKLPLLLIAEDQRELNHFIASCFEGQFRCISAYDGREALAQSLREIPDLIISDIMMPHLDGLELCQKLSENSLTSHIPVLLLTAKSGREDQLAAFHRGAVNFISKPFDPDTLVLRVQNILRSRQKFREHLHQTSWSDEPVQLAISDVDQEFLQKLRQVIEAEIGNPQLQVIDLCQKLNMSKSQLYRKMKGLLGYSANEYLRLMRLKTAADLLGNTRLSVAEITFKVGFTDLQYFRESFAKHYGQSPSEYRREQQQEPF